jgi:adenylate cyclase
MEARPCSSQWSTSLSRLCDVAQRLFPDDPKRLTRSPRRSAVGETRKLAAILVSDVVGYSRLTGADEDRILARLRALRSDLIDPTIAVHHGRVVKRTGDGAIVEFRSVVDAVNCAIEIQTAMVERNAGAAPDKRIEFRIGIHLGDVVEESDGDLMGDGVNIAARLEGIAKPGAICLSEQAYWQVKGRLDLAVSDLGPKELKNIAEPVRVYSLEVGKPAQVKPVSSTTRGKPSKPITYEGLVTAPIAAALAALLLLVAASGWYMLGGHLTKPAQAAHLSIVVLPFANLSGDPSQDYGDDGVTENLTTDLSRIRDSFVIARNTAFTYKGKNLDAKAIGKELGVRYVLEGSVQRDQNRVRVNAQLIDAESGAHLWAERFEEDVADLFKLQDQVVARLANSLGNELAKAETAKSAGSKDPDAIDLTLRGEALQREAKNNKDHEAARALFEQALKIDPNDSEALAGEAETYISEFWKNPETAYEARIVGLVDRAIALAPDSVRPYWTKSWYLFVAHRWDEAIRTADAGLATNPNFAPLYGQRAFAENGLGSFEQAKSDFRQAMRLSPHDPHMGEWHVGLGNAELGLGHYGAAIEEFHKAACCGPVVPWSLAAAYALQGKMDEAKSALAEARRLFPSEFPTDKLTIKWLVELYTPSVPPLIEGLRKAGLPEE